MNRATTRTKAINRTTATVQLDSELNKVGISAMGIGSVLVGLWAMACLIGGLLGSAGPVAFIGSWYSAVIGG
ncbi:MAG: hypothetical protein COZ12_09075 [Deltaproteobacteria bacterium CG_4_10_14_3_um_filter_60_8]|nr:MAG: hypothetical protein AUK28_08075 [Desulfobacterales bacterium CG2_30_60_27]PIP43364.1 MAG: hypothetical protein COX17_07460 [Deltaproteobacteria bacterium CG23_combo_of_CG06-09_8_20_14_all_60_8]PIY20560.1 MAG: hypothetical protein COZ12_09075 [Deltaproteobacteria bacterium CG_4_10_14_3_um_filter_60_8]